MYINGKKISLDQLQVFTDKLLVCLIEDMYKTVTTEGVDIIFPDDEYQQKKLIRKMFEFYQEREEYEKCAVLFKLQPTA